MKSKRTKFTSVSPYTRRCVLVRDGGKCIICGSKTYLTMAHVFVNRSHGGAGTKDNIVCLCKNCHMTMDNPIGDKQNELSKRYLDYCKRYIIKKEGITNINALLERITYKKDL